MAQPSESTKRPLTPEEEAVLAAPAYNYDAAEPYSLDPEPAPVYVEPTPDNYIPGSTYVPQGMAPPPPPPSAEAPPPMMGMGYTPPLRPSKEPLPRLIGDVPIPDLFPRPNYWPTGTGSTGTQNIGAGGDAGQPAISPYGAPKPPPTYGNYATEPLGGNDELRRTQHGHSVRDYGGWNSEVGRRPASRQDRPWNPGYQWHAAEPFSGPQWTGALPAAPLVGENGWLLHGVSDSQNAGQGAALNGFRESAVPWPETDFARPQNAMPMPGGNKEPWKQYPDGDPRSIRQNYRLLPSGYYVYDGPLRG